MEALYSKLYNKYSQLKKEKESQFDKLNQDQEEKFLNYAAAADEMIQYLKSENDKLQGQVDGLKNELASVRASSDEQRIHFQKLLTEENQKNMELSEEISRLEKVEHKESSSYSMPKECEEGNLHDLAKPTKNVNLSILAMVHLFHMLMLNLTVHPINLFLRTKAVVLQISNSRPAVKGSRIVQVFLKGNTSLASFCNGPRAQHFHLLLIGGDAADTSSFSCMFQHLIEFVVGLKVSPLIKSNERCLLAHHQSSGYSFSLTWISNADGEVELLYRVSSLGTFERVAPEWMKETLMFSPSMCSVFFERVSRVMKA